MSSESESHTVVEVTNCGLGFSGGSVVNNIPVNAGVGRDTGSVLGLGISPGEGNGNLLQYS